MTLDSMPHLAVPEVVGWETTLRCNMRCRHCGSTAGDARAEELNARQALALCRQIVAWGVGRAVLTGGETLAREDWPAIVDGLLSGKVEVGLLTNGWLLTGKTLKRVAGYAGKEFHVAISLDGPPEIHDHIRGLAGSFERAWQGALALKAAGVPVAVITTVNHANLPGLADLGTRLLGELRPYCWQVQVTTPFGRAREHADCALSPVEYVRAAVAVCEARRQAEGTATRVFAGDCLGYLSTLEPGLRDAPWQGCQAGLGILGIQSNGNVKGCLSIVDDRFVEGHALNDGLQAVWERPGAFAFTRRFRAASLSGPCRGCEAGRQCRGGCTANAVALSGKPGQAPFCLKTLEGPGALPRGAGSRRSVESLTPGRGAPRNP